MTAAVDTFGSYSQGLTAPAVNAATVSPSDTVDVTAVTKMIFIGTGGNLAVITAGGQTVTLTGVPDGTLLPLRVSRVMSTNTTASNVIALW